MSIRFASEADAAGLLAVYAPYIETSVTFEYDCPSLAEFAERIRTIRERWPYLVWEEDDRICGYTYAHLARERAAYGWYVELSIYLDGTCTGRGIGTQLYALLLELLRMQGVKTAMGCVTAPNPASEALHAAMGFRLTGTSRNAGYKNGQWHDVLWYELPLAPYDVPPAPVVPIRQLDPAAVDALFRRYSS